MHLRGDIRINFGQSTHTGPKEQNEDALGVRIPGDPGLLATKGISAVIADGVSAASAAKEASEAAVGGFLNDYYETPAPWEVKTSGHRVLSALNRWLFSQGLGHQESNRPPLSHRRLPPLSPPRHRAETTLYRSLFSSLSRNSLSNPSLRPSSQSTD